jgi:hypothetical protein
MNSRSSGMNAVHKFCSVAQLSTINGSMAVAIDAGFLFKLNDLTDYTKWTTLFDQYRLVKVEVMGFPINDQNQVGSGANQSELRTAVDYDNTTAFGADLLGPFGDSVRIHYSTAQWKRVLKPRIAMAAYKGALTGFANMNAQWIDSANPDVQHYGLRYYLPVSTGTVPTWRVYAKYHLEFRNQI